MAPPRHPGESQSHDRLHRTTNRFNHTGFKTLHPAADVDEDRVDVLLLSLPASSQLAEVPQQLQDSGRSEHNTTEMQCYIGQRSTV